MKQFSVPGVFCHHEVGVRFPYPATLCVLANAHELPDHRRVSNGGVNPKGGRVHLYAVEGGLLPMHVESAYDSHLVGLPQGPLFADTTRATISPCAFELKSFALLPLYVVSPYRRIPVMGVRT